MPGIGVLIQLVSHFVVLPVLEIVGPNLEQES